VTKFIRNVVLTFKKIGFSLRILQIAVIFVAYRCPIIFSVPSIIWLFVTSLTYNIHVIYYLTILCGLPASILVFFGIYYAHIPNNNLTPNIPSWLGNIDLDSFWLEYLLTFSLMVLYCNFLRQLKGVYRLGEENRSSALITGNLDFKKLGNVFLAIILKSTYYFSMLGIYLISTNKVSIFNLILVTFFIVYFISEHAAQRRWKWLIVTIILIISLRYIWALGVIHVRAKDAMDSQLKRAVSLLGIVDIEDIHSIPLTGTIADQDEMTNFLFWIMFLFVLLQYDVYRSSYIRKDAFEMLKETNVMKNHVPRYNKFVQNLNSIYYQGFVWFGYVIIAIILALKDFSLFNLSSMLFLFVIFSVHLYRLKSNPGTAHKGMYFMWSIFVVFNTVTTCARYLYSFTTFDFLNEYLLNLADKYDIFNFIINQSKLIGFTFNTNLQTKLIGDVVILMFAVSMRAIFRMYHLFYESESPPPPPGENESNMEEISLERRRISLLESFVNHRRETQRIRYQQHMMISVLEDWYLRMNCCKINDCLGQTLRRFWNLCHISFLWLCFSPLLCWQAYSGFRSGSS